jgi:carnitine-CoA ligase
VLDPFEMTRWLTARLPHFMVPRYIEVLPQLPRTPTNKVRRSELRKSGVGAGTWDRKAAGVSLRELVEEGRGA